MRLITCILPMLLLAACAAPATRTPSEKPLIGVVVDAGNENDRSFNQYTLQGAREAAAAAQVDFTWVGSQSNSDYEQQIEQLISRGADLVITVGFRQGEATARTARRHPTVRFAILDNAYAPGAGCPETVADCYSPEGGLGNVTSLMFAEDQVAYLAGTLAACMSRTSVVASIAGLEIPPVMRFVTGFKRGAQDFNSQVMILNQYIPDFNDPDTGQVVAQDFISKGADVIFVAAGNTGNGGLLAAHQAGAMGIGVDVDQYYTYPDVAASLLSSASKNVDVAAADAVRSFAAGTLGGGIRTATLANGGVGLAPYHDWDSKIPQMCKDAVAEASAAVQANPAITGAPGA